MKILVWILLFGFFQACQNEEKIAEQLDPENKILETATEVEQYKGLIPCADCMGIEVVLTLLSDQSYTESNTYLTDKVENPHHIEKGKFEWRNDTLYLRRKEGVSMKLRTDTALIAFDSEGNLMSDVFGSKYNLKKVF